jgi:hypothetical protein
MVAGQANALGEQWQTNIDVNDIVNLISFFFTK